MDRNPPPRVSLEQWRSFIAVVDAGGYAHAAERLSKSQSTVTYAVQKLESQLGVAVFTTEGRKATLTPAGRMLVERARLLVDEAGGLERAARRSSAGWEAEIRIAVEVLFPTWLMLKSLDRFGAESPQTRIELYETVLDGTSEALREGRVDLAITPRIPPNMNGELLMPMRFLPVAHPDHPLHRLGRELSLRDLREHRHVLVRDSGSRRDAHPETMNASQRWTVTNMATSIGAVCRGYGFAWFPSDKIVDELANGILKVLPLEGGAERSTELYLVYADPDSAGPGLDRLAAIIREDVRESCSRRAERGTPSPVLPAS